MTSLGMGEQLAKAQSAQPALLGAMKSAAEDAGPALEGIPGAAEFMNAAMAYAGRLSEAVNQVASAADLGTALKTGGSPIDDARLRAGISELRTALPMKQLINHLEKLFTHPDVAARIKEKFGEEEADIASVREALKKVQPSTVLAFKGLHEALTALEAHEAVATSGPLKATMAQMHTDLGSILNDFGKDIERLVKVCDTWVATFE
jgi:hypothetical protein